MTNIIYLDHKSYWDAQAEDYINQIEKWLQKSSTYESMRTFSLIHSRLDWSTRRRCSRAGWYPNKGGVAVSIAMWPACGDKNPKDRIPMKVYEYRAYENDLEIGNFYTDDNHHKLLMIICHEMAHAAQYFHRRFHKMGRIKPHGNEFKMFYREIRNHWLNPHIPNQEAMGLKFREHKNMSVMQEYAA